MKTKSLNIAMLGHKHMLSREGGIEVVVYELVRRMSQRGHSITVYDRGENNVADGKTEEKKCELHGVKIVPVWTMEKKGLAALTSSFSAALKVAFSLVDVVHIHAEGPAAVCAFVKLIGRLRGKKTKVVVTIHGLDWQRAKWGRLASTYIKFGEKQAVKYADEIIVLSCGIQEYFARTYGRKTVFIPNGVTVPEIKEPVEIKKQWGLEKDSFVLFLGRIVPEKGLRYLVEAWKSVKTEKKLVICGGSSDTADFMDELKNLAAADERIIFTGFRQGRILEELFSNSYIYCLPSDLEGMPLSLLEAMSYGNCCLVSDIQECVEVVEDKAAIFAHSSVFSLRSKLQELLDNEQLVEVYKAGAAEFICRKYKWDDVVDRTLELYVS